MTKYLCVTMPDGSKWKVAAHLIANNRAEYYADKEEEEFEQEEVHAHEYEFTLNDDLELIDWATNNMDWEDVSIFATIIEEPEVDYQEGWVNGEHSIIEEE